jgi:hypothetical protein
MAAPTKYPDELCERAVRLYRSSTPRPTFRQLGEQLGVHHEALRGTQHAVLIARAATAGTTRQPVEPMATGGVRDSEPPAGAVSVDVVAGQERSPPRR